MGRKLGGFFGALLDGPTGPPSELAATRWWFLRALGVVCLLAIASLWWQAAGLFGSEGVVPVDPRFTDIANRFAADYRGGAELTNMPSVLWFARTDAAITGWCALARRALCGRRRRAGDRCRLLALPLARLRRRRLLRVSVGHPPARTVLLCVPRRAGPTALAPKAHVAGRRRADEAAGACLACRCSRSCCCSRRW